MKNKRRNSNLGSGSPSLGRALWIGFALASIALGVFGNPPHYAQALAGQESAKKPERTYNTLFNPSSQKPVSVESRNLIISLRRSEDCSTCPAGRAFLFEVKHKQKGTIVEFHIANDTAQVDQVYVVDSERAAIVGRIQSSTSIVNLVDVNTGKVLDEFWCFDPSVSPSNRFVAYAKVFPLHFVPGVSYEYLVYDLAASPGENRTPPNKGRTTDRYDVGWPVYPENLINSPNDNILARASLAHSTCTDGFFWLGKSDTVAFVDRWQGVDSLVVADVSAGVQHPRVGVYPIDTAAVVDLPGCKSKVAPSDFERWSESPATLIRVTDIGVSPEDPRALRLQFSPQPCLGTSHFDIRVGSAATPHPTTRDQPPAQ
jgi:hypothetical protein